MADTFNAVPFLDTLTNALSQAWARLGQRQFEPLARWQLMHIDQNGELQHAAVDVLEAMPLERLILVRHSSKDEPLVIKIGRIVEAIDVPTGRKIRIDQWLACASAGSGIPRAHASSGRPSQALPSMPFRHPQGQSIGPSPRR